MNFKYIIYPYNNCIEPLILKKKLPPWKVNWASCWVRDCHRLPQP